ncbi:MAG: nitroreductase family protein [Candidatus Glassbacteria bacterium]
MDTLEAIKARRSIRQYESTPVDWRDLEQVVDAGRLAATGRGVEPWEFVVVTDSARRKELAGICDFGKCIAEAPACIVVLCRDTKYYLEDGAAATQNMLVAAAALGLGSCWVAGDKKPYAERIVKLVGAGAGFRLVSLVAVGYASAEQPPRKCKRPLAEVLHREMF